MNRVLCLLIVVGFAWTAACLHAEDAPARVSVTVVVVLATADNNVVDPKLTTLAKEVQKRNPQLVGYKLVSATSKSIPVGATESIDLIDKQQLKVTVDKPRGEDGRVGLTIVPPGLGKISYDCVCSKFFPVVTPYTTKNGEVLLVAVMGKPCTLHLKD